MERKLENWKSYHEQTSELAPRPLLVEALPYVEHRDTALDLGAGSLNDTRHLLAAGFKSVVAVDAEPTITERSRSIQDPRLVVQVAPFQTFEFVPESYDLVNAQYSLPFVSRDDFERVVHSVIASLRPNGIFTGQFFGARDDWNGIPERTFLTREEAEEVLSQLELIKFNEEEYDGATAAGPQKHWHIFDIIGRKPSS